jgi:ferric-dicitrate binding protein FerR (iron transport regulator)
LNFFSRLPKLQLYSRKFAKFAVTNSRWFMDPARGPEHIHELIQLHLDGAASESEQAELNRLLAGDPEVTDAFVRAVRHEANLEGVLRERWADAGMEAMLADVLARGRAAPASAGEAAVSPAPAGRVVPLRRWLPLGAAAAAAVLLAVVGAGYFGGREGGDGAPQGTNVASGAAGVESSASPPGRAADVAGLAGVEGDVTVVGVPDAAPVRGAAAALADGRGVRTGPGGRATVAFPDGTRLELSPETELSRIEVAREGGRRVTVARGVLAADVAKQPDGRPMVFGTPHAAVEVVGTRFTLAVAAGVTRVEMEEGVVRLSRPAGGRDMEVRAGRIAVAAEGMETIVFGGAGAPWQEMFNGNDLTGWRPTRGRWRAAAGALAGGDESGEASRIETAASFRDFEMVCRVRVEGAPAAVEWQGRWAASPPAAGEAWRELRLVAHGGVVVSLLDGRPLGMNAEGRPVEAAEGPVAFAVEKGGRVTIRDVMMRRLAR